MRFLQKKWIAFFLTECLLPLLIFNNSMGKNLLIALSALSIAVCVSCNYKSSKHNEAEQEEQESKSKYWASIERFKMELEQKKDPKLGYVPSDRLITAKNYTDNLIAIQANNAAISGISWTSLGPNNQGGRSRSMIVDRNDATGKTVIVASVGGGLFRTTDITAANPNWTPVNDFFSNLAITSIAQDPSNALNIYFATGETGYGNVDAIRGNGVWKSTDGGVTFSQLTASSTFTQCYKIAVNSSGHVLVATNGSGLQRSTNGGTSFTKVLGSGVVGGNNRCYDVDIAANGNIFASLEGSIHKSTDNGATFAAAQTLPAGSYERIELACAPSDANYVYALVEASSVVSAIIATTDGGTTWTSKTEPADADPGIPATDFSREQAWYDLTIAVSPTDRLSVMVGGVDLFKSTNGGTTWGQIAHWYGGFGFQNVHADQHFIYYDPNNSAVAYFLNDGGIYRTTNAGAAIPTIADKGTNYVSAQFYSCAIHPTAGTNHFLAGAQDNGSHKFTSGVMQPTTEVTGGDGAFVHIDQNQPQFQFTSYVRNNYYRSTNGGTSFTAVDFDDNGQFINPTDYDDVANMLYCGYTANNFLRWTNAATGNTFEAFSLSPVTGTVSAVKVSPNTANVVYFGTSGGRIAKVTNANAAAPAVISISTGLPAGYISCIEVQPGDENHIIATFTNYGTNSVMETTNGGTSWTNIEGNLPDMPVRWALFNPNNTDQLVIATELGVWTTDDINGASTNWGTTNNGLANVRVDMLQYRASDKFMIAATHGRGLYLTKNFAPPASNFEADKTVVYTGVPVSFSNTSANGTSFSWNFGDGTTSTLENPTRTFINPGKYDVTLTINGGVSSLTRTTYIHVLPNLGTPYTAGLGGDFESNPNHFGSATISGTGWQRGNSSVAGKNGTQSGSNAWVTGLTDANYAANSDASIYSPNYNFTAAGTYTIKLYAKRNVETNYDGFRVEYSLDSGRNWTPLGTAVLANWYNFANTTAGDPGAFPLNQAFFSGAVANYTQYSFATSALGGNKRVAFRIRFKSDGSVEAPGVAIDNFEVDGPANASTVPLQLLQFSAYANTNDVVLNWQAANEINMSHYEVERSTNGVDFTYINKLSSYNSLLNKNYTLTDFGTATYRASVLYYRLKMIDRNGLVTYSNIAKVAQRNLTTDMSIGPNPFVNQITIYSKEAISQVQIINQQGKVMQQVNQLVGNVLAINPWLSAGNYWVVATTVSGKKVSKQLLKTF